MVPGRVEALFTSVLSWGVSGRTLRPGFTQADPDLSECERSLAFVKQRLHARSGLIDAWDRFSGDKVLGRACPRAAQRFTVGQAIGSIRSLALVGFSTGRHPRA